MKNKFGDGKILMSYFANIRIQGRTRGHLRVVFLFTVFFGTTAASKHSGNMWPYVLEFANNLLYLLWGDEEAALVRSAGV